LSSFIFDLGATILVGVVITQAVIIITGQLPVALEQKIYQEVAICEEKLEMEYIPSFERIALKKGFKQGVEQEKDRSRQLLLESLKISLEIKFGKKALLLLPAMSKLKLHEDLIAFQRQLKTAKSIEELKKCFRHF
jgi:hypothetical protein